MRRVNLYVVLFLLGSATLFGQSGTDGSGKLPSLIRFSGVLRDATGQARSGALGITFSLYSEQEGGAPLWLETQSVACDSSGHYTVLLGSQQMEGIPLSLFASNEARWLGIRGDDGTEQARVLLVSVPYALKAGDSETVGGFSPSQLMALAQPAANSTSGSSAALVSDRSGSRVVRTPDSTSGEPGPRVSMLLNGSLQGVLEAFDDQTQTPLPLLFNPQGGNVGIGTTTPGQRLSVAGTIESTTGGFKFPDSSTQTTAGVSQVFSDNRYLQLTGGTITGNLTAQSFTGSGINLTSLDTNQLISKATIYKVFETATGPRQLLFDGSNIWVTDRTAELVQKFRASDGQLLATIALAAGSQPYGIAFDGNNIWVSNFGTTAAPGTTLTEIRASDAQKLGDFTVGSMPYGLTYDGSNIWVANFKSNSIMKIDPATGSVLGTYTTGTGPAFLVSDGTNIWVTITTLTDANLQSSTPGSVQKFRASDGQLLTTVPAGKTSTRIAFDGQNVWVTNLSDATVTKIRASDNSVAGTIPVGNFPVAILFDGTAIWVANDENNGVAGTLMKLAIADGTKLLTLTANGLQAPIEGVRGMTFDGNNLWVGSAAYNTITKVLQNPSIGQQLAQLGLGDGSGLTNLNASYLTGTIAPGLLPGQTVGSDPRRIAVLDWSQKPAVPQTIILGGSPAGLASDGANVWVSDGSVDSATKVRQSDGSVVGKFAIGGASYGAAFDGSNVWFTNYYASSVTKVRASDGKLLGTYSVGTSPIRLCFDGVNVWVANYGSNNVTKIKAADGTVLGTYNVGTHPFGIAYDGTNIWVADQGTNDLSVLNPNDGSVLATYPLGNLTSALRDVAFDGQNIWVTSLTGLIGSAKIRRSDGAVIGKYTGGYGIAFDGANMWLTTFANSLVQLRAGDGKVMATYPTDNTPITVLYDGGSIWVANNGSGTVTKVSAPGIVDTLNVLAAGDGSPLTTVNASALSGAISNANLPGVTLGPSPQQAALQDLSWENPTFKSYLVGKNPQGVAFDKSNIWVTNKDDNTVTKLRASDGTLQGTYPVGTQPTGIAFDGANVWVANFGSNNITKLRASDGSNLGTFPVGTNPIRVCFDGSNIWVTNNGSANVTAVKLTDGSTIGTYNVGSHPYGIVFDPYYGRLWIANQTDNTLTILTAATGALVATIPATQGPQDLAYDGSYVWASSSASTNIQKFSTFNNAPSGTYYGGQKPISLIFDGASMWVLDYVQFYHSLFKLRTSDGGYLFDWAVGEYPTAGVFDGSNIWFTSSTQGVVWKWPAGIVTNLNQLALGDGKWLSDLNASAIGFGTLSKDRLDLGYLDSRYLQLSAPLQTVIGNVIFAGNLTTNSLNPHDLIVSTTSQFLGPITGTSAAWSGSLSGTSANFTAASTNSLFNIVNTGTGTALAVQSMNQGGSTLSAITGNSSNWVGVEGAGAKAGIYGHGSNYGVWGQATAGSAQGVYGSSSTGTAIGVEGDSTSSYGVYGTSGSSVGVYGVSGTIGVEAYNSSNGHAAYLASGCCGGYFTGDVYVGGTLSKAAGSFKIDHPLDPANKYLSHSFVESPDMMNIYNGNVTTDAKGYAVVTLPDWFMALNKDFRYQLTVIGTFAQAIVDEEVSENHFRIRTDHPKVKVSWQVTGIRHDAYAVAHPIIVEEEKTGAEKGTYTFPELYGQPQEKSTHHALFPERKAPVAK